MDCGDEVFEALLGLEAALVDVVDVLQQGREVFVSPPISRGAPGTLAVLDHEALLSHREGRGTGPSLDALGSFPSRSKQGAFAIAAD
jgi:hypothetical protein